MKIENLEVEECKALVKVEPRVIIPDAILPPERDHMSRALFPDFSWFAFGKRMFIADESGRTASVPIGGFSIPNTGD